MMYETGMHVRPIHPRGNFSKANWDDHEDVREGKRTIIRTTSKLIKVVGKLTNEQWERIENAGMAESRGRRTVVPADIVSIDRDGTDDSDFELVDDEIID